MCREKFPDLRLYRGNEIYGYIDAVEQMQQHEFRTLGDSNIALVEFRNDTDYRKICNVLQAVGAAGYRPMLAHAERCICLASDVRRIYELVTMRVLIQVNASAFRRRLFITPVNSFVFRLMDDDLVTAVASDAHGFNTRTPHLLYAYEAVRKRYGQAYANKVFYENPVRILTGKYGKEEL